MKSRMEIAAITEEEYRKEAERLFLLPLAEQREIIALHRSVASNPKIPKRDRDAGRARAAALEKLLGLRRKSPKRNPRGRTT